MSSWIDREWGEQCKYSKGDKVTLPASISRSKFVAIDLGSRYDGVGRVQECYGRGGYTDDREISYLVLWDNGTYGTYGESSLDKWVDPPLAEEDAGKIVIKFDLNKEARMTGSNTPVFPELFV